MKSIIFTLTLLSALPILTGFTIVYDQDLKSEISAGPEGDMARNEQRLKETFTTKLLPLISEKALTLGNLHTEITKNLDKAGQTFGNRGAGMGAPWNFSVHDSGKITDAKLKTSARSIDVDVNEDGMADVTVQLGPVIRGTAIRDFSPYYNFDDFRDQIEFAKLARVINDRIKSQISVPDGELVGRKVSFSGIVVINNSKSKLVVTPISVEFDQ